MGRLDTAKCSQNIDNTGSTENENPSKTFVRPDRRREKKKKLRIKARPHNLDLLSIEYCVNGNKDAFCFLLDTISRHLMKGLGYFL